MTGNQTDGMEKIEKAKTIEEDVIPPGRWDCLYQCATGLVLVVLLTLFILYVAFSIYFTFRLMISMSNPEGWLINLNGNEELSLQIRIAQSIAAGILVTISFTVGRTLLRILGLARRGKIESVGQRLGTIEKIDLKNPRRPLTLKELRRR